MTDPQPRSYRTTEMTGQVHDHGAQVTGWTPAGGQDVLWLSPTARYAAGEAIRGGVPISFPWFAAGRTGERRPRHGFARTAPWRLVDEHAGPSAVSLGYELTDVDASDPRFPGPYRAYHRIGLGPGLALDLTVTNTGSDPFEVELALHTYLQVGDVRRIWLEGLEGVGYLDKTDGSQRTQDGPVRVTGPTDRVYRSNGPVSLVDPVLGRTLLVGARDAHNIIVWNPGEQAGSAMDDIGADQWSRFVCIEAGSVGEDAVTLAPGASYTLGYRLRIEAEPL